MIKRMFDIVFSLISLIVLLPFIILISVLIIIDSRGGVFYKQIRVGKNNSDFSLYKFRTMHKNAEKKGLLTIGSNDARITRIGYFLRKFKIDEWPQLFNVLIGDMSVVGPRPEVRKYVELYDEEQKQVLEIRPGITDYASIKYIAESDLLSKSNNPEKTYIEQIMPEKLKINLIYKKNPSVITDLKIVLLTILKIVRIKR